MNETIKEILNRLYEYQKSGADDPETAYELAQMIWEYSEEIIDYLYPDTDNII